MNALVYRLPVIYLVGMGLVACSAAGENGAGPNGGDDDQPGLELSVGAAASAPSESDSHSAGGSTGQTDKPLSDGQTAGKGSSGNGGGSGAHGNCDCDADLPGVTIDQSDDGITIVVDLPNDGSIVIATRDGDCKTNEGGVHITGDVMIDLGNGDIPLLGADLHVGVGGGMPTIAGTADVDAGLLDGMTGVAGGDLHVAVSLDPNVERTMPESDAQALLNFQLSLPSVGLGCGCFPAMNGDLPIVHADVVASVDGANTVVKITGDVAANAGAVWTSMVPVHATGALAAMATLNDGALVRVELDGDVAVDNGALWCGLAPLAAIDLPSAKLVLDDQGAMLSAITHAALHPGFSLTGEAELRARFERHDWSINLCGAAMADLTVISAKVATCLDLNASGAKVCDKPMGG